MNDLSDGRTARARRNPITATLLLLLGRRYRPRIQAAPRQKIFVKSDSIHGTSRSPGTARRRTIARLLLMSAALCACLGCAVASKKVSTREIDRPLSDPAGIKRVSSTVCGVILSVLLTVIIVFSQEINISGKVTDTSGVTPIAGAVVKLEKHGCSTSTGADGYFTLTEVSSIGSNIHYFQPNALLANIRNGMLSVYLPARSSFTITSCTIQGKVVSKIQKELDMGAYCIAQPSAGYGVYVYKIQAGSSELVMIRSSLGQIQGVCALSRPAMAARRTSPYVPIDDVIFASKEGLLNYRVMAKNADTSGIMIKMIPSAGNITDADGNVYQSVRIGNQVWMAENLRTTKYNDGTAIPYITDAGAWAALYTPGYCFYSNTTDASYQKKWGALYNWYVVTPTNPKRIAPAGWRVPSDTDLNTLQNFLIVHGYNWDGSITENMIAKAMAARTDWQSSTFAGEIGNDLNKNNESGFSALPGGYRSLGGNFFEQSRYGYWWSTSEYDVLNACSRILCYDGQNLRGGDHIKHFGFSVRLLRD